MNLFNLFKKEDKRLALIRNKFDEEKITAVVRQEGKKIEVEYLLFNDENCMMRPSYYSEEDRLEVENKIKAVMAYYGYLDNDFIMYADVI
ncbi:hypothetical protein UFVDC4_00157 [Staphylococcus phage vB_SauM-UFV_DC4]|nr:hypothetical protein UFVDC4_00157 [Staphylococcus phage vB_SauM-UFV_DC4]